jgi:hypothetical protein
MAPFAVLQVSAVKPPRVHRGAIAATARFAVLPTENVAPGTEGRSLGAFGRRKDMAGTTLASALAFDWPLY